MCIRDSFAVLRSRGREISGRSHLLSLISRVSPQHVPDWPPLSWADRTGRPQPAAETVQASREVPAERFQQRGCGPGILTSWFASGGLVGATAFHSVKSRRPSWPLGPLTLSLIHISEPTRPY